MYKGTTSTAWNLGRSRGIKELLFDATRLTICCLFEASSRLVKMRGGVLTNHRQSTPENPHTRLSLWGK